MSCHLLLLTALLASVLSVRGQCPSPEAPSSGSPDVINTPLYDSFSSNGLTLVDNDGDSLTWSLQPDNIDCQYMAVSCQNLSATQDNWLFTPELGTSLNGGQRIITVTVLVDLTLNCSESSCSDAIGLYAYNYNSPGSDMFDPSSFISVVSPLVSGMDVTVDVSAGDSFVLGLRDSGTCITVNRVQVYYSSCANIAAPPYASVPSEVPFGNSFSVTCVAGSTATGDLTATCSSTGVTIPNVCECEAGYSGADGTTCTACPENMFKSMSGDASCLPCPNFSENTGTGNTQCDCVQNHNRVDPSSITAACDICDADFYVSTNGECLSCPMGSNSNGSVESCLCNTGLETSDMSTTTTTSACDRCQANFFRSGGDCIACPMGSTSNGGNEESCMCDNGLATSNMSPTTTGEDCDSCREGYFRSGGNCVGCPMNSMREFLADEGSCTCNANYVTAGGMSMTSDSAVSCDGCAVTHYSNGDACVECPDGSESPGPGDIACTCLPGLISSGGTLTTSEQCSTIVGFTETSLTVPEGSDSQMLMLSILSGQVLSQVAINLQIDSEVITLPSTSLTLTTSATPSSNQVALSLEGNEQAFNSYSPSVISIVPSDNVVIGGTVDGTMVYSNVTVVVVEDDSVSVGFTNSRLMVNETERIGRFMVRRIGGISSNLELRVTLSRPGVVNVTMPSVIFTPSGPETLGVEFIILDNNVGGQTTSEVVLRLSLVEPQEFNDAIIRNDPSLSDELVVAVLDDDVPQPPTPLPLEIIIGVCVGAAALACLVLLIIVLIVCICRLRSVNRQGFYPTYEDQSKEPPTMLRYSASLRSISSQTVVPIGNSEGAVIKENEFYV